MKTIYGIIGKSLAHTFSPAYFHKKFKQEGLKEHRYEKFTLKDISEIERVFKKKGLAGLNVTIPYKESVIPYLDELSPAAEEIGAVNVIQFKKGKKIGHNTDYTGFQKSIRPFLENIHEHALIFGTGGSAKSIAYALTQLGIEARHVSRTKTRRGFLYRDLTGAHFKYFKLLVNCTPVGMFPEVNHHLPLPYDDITAEHLVVDLIYNPEKSLYLTKAEEQGAQILNGKDMLIFQAEDAWKIWHEE